MTDDLTRAAEAVLRWWVATETTDWRDHFLASLDALRAALAARSEPYFAGGEPLEASASGIHADTLMRQRAAWNIDADGVQRSPEWWQGYEAAQRRPEPRAEGLREAVDRCPDYAAEDCGCTCHEVPSTPPAPALDVERLARALVASGLMRRYADYANRVPTMIHGEPKDLAKDWAWHIAREYVALAPEPDRWPTT